ncbi:MAG: helix-turn-helix domain-containing protein [Hormoscilla sp. SP12CHS1]|nr:helix-turn-helix domain-containing protein [Hormoscilla sp. SP12CHS1]
MIAQQPDKFQLDDKPFSELDKNFFRSNLSTRLKKLREGKNLTQKALAEKLGVNSNTVSCWEREMYVPQFTEVYNTTIGELLTEIIESFPYDSNLSLTLNIRLGPRLKEVREQRGFSTRDVENMANANIKHQHVSLWELDKKACTLFSLLRLCSLYKISLDQFLIGVVFDIEQPPDSLGTRIKAKRELAGLKQEDLATKIGCNENTIGLWERNVNLPDREAIEKLAVGIKTTVHDLLDGLGLSFYSNHVKKTDFGKRLQKLRKEQKLNKVKFAKPIDVTDATICHWESGQHCPTDANLLAIAKVFKIPVYELIGMNPDEIWWPDPTKELARSAAVPEESDKVISHPPKSKEFAYPVIYVFKSVLGIIKVGFTTRIGERQKELQRWEGKLEFLKAVPGNLAQELEIHKYLSSNGEAWEGSEWYPIERQDEILQVVLDPAITGSSKTPSTAHPTSLLQNPEARAGGLCSCSPTL